MQLKVSEAVRVAVEKTRGHKDACPCRECDAAWKGIDTLDLGEVLDGGATDVWDGSRWGAGLPGMDSTRTEPVGQGK